MRSMFEWIVEPVMTVETKLKCWRVTRDIRELLNHQGVCSTAKCYTMPENLLKDLRTTTHPKISLCTIKINSNKSEKYFSCP